MIGGYSTGREDGGETHDLGPGLPPHQPSLLFLYGLDKWKAVHGRWRISERTLLLAALAGGFAGALTGMYFFHHKTRHKKFVYGVPLIGLLELAAAMLLVL